MRFTTANARENAAKALASRKANFLAMKAAKNAQPEIAQPATAIAGEKSSCDDYTLRTLSRVRFQLDRLHKLMSAEKDPARLDRLAAAFGKLSEVERQLAGRPLPGSLRPTGKSTNAGMIEQPATAAPVSSATPAVQDDGQE